MGKEFVSLTPICAAILMDFGILIDTLECAVTWQQLPKVHEQVRAFVKSHPRTICMTHLSHAYSQGANLYFIFIARMHEIDEYLSLQYGILQAIENRARLSATITASANKPRPGWKGRSAAPIWIYCAR